MKWSCATALLAALLASGCGGGSSATTGQRVRTHGVLVRIGGPSPGGPVALRGVRLHFRGSGESADVRTGRRGRFAFDVIPGTYRVTVTAAGPQANGGSIRPAPDVIRVPHARRLRLVVNVK